MISDKLRKVENLHILFWLVKDTCWCLLSETVGMIMIIPTVLVAIWIAIRTRKQPSEFAHNLAVLFWICANSIWMIGEFRYGDGTRPYALIFFSAGLLTLAIFYSSILIKRFR